MGWNSQPTYTQEVEKLTKRLAKSDVAVPRRSLYSAVTLISFIWGC